LIGETNIVHWCAWTF